MESCLFIVSETYQGSLGFTLLPGVRLRDPRPEVRTKIIQGVGIELRRPDGSTIHTTLVTYGMSVQKHTDGSFSIEGELEDQYIYFVLPENLSANDVPVGTEVWLVEEA